jgi:hypothetical protein
VRLQLNILGIHPDTVLVFLVLQAYLYAGSLVEFAAAMLQLDAGAGGRPTDETIQRGIGCY